MKNIILGCLFITFLGCSSLPENDDWWDNKQPKCIQTVLGNYQEGIVHLQNPFEEMALLFINGKLKGMVGPKGDVCMYFYKTGNYNITFKVLSDKKYNLQSSK